MSKCVNTGGCSVEFACLAKFFPTPEILLSVFTIFDYNVLNKCKTTCFTHLLNDAFTSIFFSQKTIHQQKGGGHYFQWNHFPIVSQGHLTGVQDTNRSQATVTCPWLNNDKEEVPQ